MNETSIDSAHRLTDLKALAARCQSAPENDPRSAPTFHQLGVALAQRGHIADAYECYMRALRFKPGHPPVMAAIAALQSSLPSNLARARILKTAVDARPYSLYLSPFQLLNWDISSLTECDEAELRRRKKRALAEVQLNDGKISWLRNAVVEESSVRRALDELDSPERRLHHFLIYRRKHLLWFLTHRYLGYFASFDKPEHSPLIPYDDPEFIAVIEKPFAQQYNLALSQAWNKADSDVVQALALRYLPVSTLLHDECFTAAYQHAKELTVRISHERTRAEESPEQASAAFDALAALVRVDFLNCLPSYFADVRREIAMAIRSIAIICNNKHDAAKMGIAVLGLAQSLKVDTATTGKIADDHVVLSANVKAATANDVDIVIGKNRLRIDSKQFAFGATYLGTPNITGVRWGVFKHYTNGSQTSCSYMVSARSASTVATVECHEKHFFARENEAESIARYQKVVMACLASVVPRLVEDVVRRIYQNGSVAVGDCVMTKNGVSFTTGALFWRKDRLVPWRDVECSLSAGYAHLRSRHERGVGYAADVREVWNAVLLEFITDAMKKKGEA